MKKILFFNTVAGIGSTTLVYNLAWVFARQGFTTLAVDADPQMSLTSMFFEDLPPQASQGRWGENVSAIEERLFFLASHPSLREMEETLFDLWHEPLAARQEAGSFCERIEDIAQGCQAEVVLFDVAKTIGCLNRVIASMADRVVIPLGIDHFVPFHLDLRSIMLFFKGWKKGAEEGILRPAEARVAGAVWLQRRALPKEVEDRRLTWLGGAWQSLIVEGGFAASPSAPPEHPSFLLQKIPHHPGLASIASQVKKPMFLLSPADGASGSLQVAIKQVYQTLSRCALAIQ